MKPISFSFLRFLVTGALFVLPAIAHPVSCTSPSAIVNSIRNEGKTEQVGDFTFACTNDNNGTIFATVTTVIEGSLPLTSMTLDATSGQTEAAVVVVTVGGAAQTRFGAVSGSTVTFANTPIPVGTSSLFITNVRVDATSIVIQPGSAPSVTESVTVTGTQITSADFGPLVVGTVARGLTSSVTGVVNFGAGTSIAADAPASTVNFGEGLQTAFKVRGSSILDSNIGDWLFNNTESGYFVQLTVTGGTVSNNAHSGTRVRIIFNNIPAGISVYVPASLATDQVNTRNDGLPYGTAVATSSESGPFSPPPIATAPPGYSGTAQLIQLAVSDGTAEAIYEVMQNSLQVVESYSVPVFLSGTVPAGAGTSTATISFVAMVTPGTIPDFKQLAGSTSTFDMCQFSLAVSTSALAAGEEGVTYSQTLAASGGTPPYSWSLDAASASHLSALGLTLNTFTGEISGTPAAAGSASITVTVTDISFSTSTRQLIVNIAPAVVINTTSLPSGEVNSVYNASLSASYGTGGYTWMIATGTFPPGLSLNPSTGAITGTPYTAESYTFTAAVQDSVGHSAFRQLTIVINPAALSISTTSLPAATQGAAYNQTLSAAGGAGGYSWSVVGGTFTQAGFSLNSSTGAITGTPNTAGTLQLAVQVTDSAKATATRGFSLTISLATASSFDFAVANASVSPAFSPVPDYDVLRVSGDGAAVTYICSGAACGAHDITSDTAGNIYGHDGSGITKFSPTQSPTQILSLSGGTGGIALDGLGNIIFVDNATDAVYRVKLDGTGLTQVATFPIQSPDQAQHTYVAMDHSGNYIVASDENSTITVYSFTPAGSAATLASISGQTGGVEVDSAGNIVLTNYWGPSLLKISPQYRYAVSTIAQGNPLMNPLGLTIEPGTGDFIVVDYGEAKSVLRVTPTGAVTTIVTDNPYLYAPVSVTFIPAHANGGPLTIAPTSLPGGTAGQNYGPVTLWASGGSGNCTWWATGLPAGVTMSASGMISGVPATAGSFNVSITAQDQVTDQTGTLSVTLFINAQLSSLSVSVSSSVSSIDVAVGGTVSATFSASGGKPPYAYQAFGLPAGVTLSANGTLSGAPSQPGNFLVTVLATDAQPATGSAYLAVNVLGLDVTSLPAGTVGQFYSAAVTATGGVPPYSFAAAALPAGLWLSASGTISGTVHTSGIFSLTISVTDGNGVASSGTLSLTLNKPPALTISSAVFPAGEVSKPYSESAAAKGGAPPYTWSISSGTPPAGLTFRSSGVLAGIPTSPGPFTFGVMVTDAAGATAIAPASLQIQPAPLGVTSGSLLPSGMLGVPYPRQLLGANGGVAPYTWAISGHSFPAGISLSPSGLISGVPNATGDFTEAVTVTDATGAKGTVNVSMSIRPPLGPDLQLTAGTLIFSLPIPATAPPAAQSVGVLPTDPDHQVSYGFSVSPPVPWLNVTSGSFTPSALTVAITQAALSLNPGDYEATITVTCTSSSCSGHSLVVVVDLVVGSRPAELRVLNSLVSFATISGASAPIKGSMTIQNAGGGTIGFGAIACEAAWCTVGTAPQTLGGGVSAQIPITVNPGRLSAGYYRTQVNIASSAGKGVLPVGLLIAPLATMYLMPAGMQFEMPAGSSPGNPEGSFYVTVTDATADKWSAALLPGAPWLTLNTANGSSSNGQPGVVSFSINRNAASLDPRPYYGRIRVTSSTLINSPQDFEVVLNVVKATDPLRPEPQPAGLLFITQAGASTPPQNVTVYSGSAAGLTFQASTTTAGGANWLSVSPSIGVTSANTPAATQVSVNAAALKPGIYTGGIGYSLSAAQVSTVNVTLIVVGTPGGSQSGSGARISAADCVPNALAVTHNGLVNNFWSPAAWPTPMSILLSDTCGNPVGTGQIVATFSNGDPPLVLQVVDPATGLYSGTWTPRNSSAQMSIVVRASADGFPDATSELLGTAIPNNAPILTPASTLHIFNPVIGDGLAPGTIVQIYGENLASGPEAVTTMPLPTEVTGTEVVIGGISAPLYYVSPGQVNAQLPFELDAARPYQVILIANGALTTPDTVQLAPAMPGMAALADSSLIAQHSDGSLVTADNPARPGEYLVAYLAGMGCTNDLPASGTGSPSDPLARPDFQPTLTINDSPYPIAFAGLTPGMVGLYQMNFQVPAGLPEGNIKLVVWQNEHGSNQSVLPYRP